MALTTYTAGEVLTAASLNANFTFAASGGGLIAQVVSTVYTSSELTVTSTSMVTANLTATITPTLNTSKIYIVVSSCGSISSANYLSLTVFRGTVAGTNLASGGFFTRNYNSSAGMAINFLDSPATTSATTYTVGVKVNGGTGYLHMNGANSVITLMEVLA